MTSSEISSFKSPSSVSLALHLTRQLIDANSLNDYMERVLPTVGKQFGTQQLLLVDYYEQTNHFELVHFEGFPPDSRFLLQRRFGEMELERALTTSAPYLSEKNPHFFCMPLCFREVLEAVLVLLTEEPLQQTPSREEEFEVLSSLLGLFMSSTRLEVNRQQLVDLNDLQRAREIQLNFLPRGYPEEAEVEIYGFNSSSNLVGGDYFDFFDQREDSIQCILADACGHGMAAAIIMSNFRGLLQSEINRHTHFDKLFDRLNHLLHFDDELIQYLTCVFLSFDRSASELEYLNAGHYDPIVVGCDGKVRHLPGGGPPLGMFKGSTYPQGLTRVFPGDLLILYTDGLADIQDEKGEYFGTERIAEEIRENRQLPIEEIVKGVVQTAQEFSGTSEFEDDVTLFLIRIR